MEALVLDVLKRVVEELETEIRLLAAGQRAILDVSGGKIVDTSRETLSQKRVYKERLSGLISQLEASSTR
jgi:hypothetical protein